MAEFTKRINITASLDSKSVDTTSKGIEELTSKTKKFHETLEKISSKTNAFSKQLGGSFVNSVKKLEDIAKRQSLLEKQLNKKLAESRSATGSDKESIDKEVLDLKSQLEDLGKSVKSSNALGESLDDLSNSLRDVNRQSKNLINSWRKNVDGLNKKSPEEKKGQTYLQAAQEKNKRIVDAHKLSILATMKKSGASDDAIKAKALEIEHHRGTIGMRATGALKEAGGSALDSIIGKFTSFLPAITSVAGVISELVSIISDVMNGAAEFNKTLISSTASMGEFKYGTENYEKAHKELYLSAKSASVEMLNLGLDEKEASRRISSLTKATGMSIVEINERMKVSSGGLNEFIRSTDAVSRSLGISYDEMMGMTQTFTESFGKSLDGVKNSFMDVSKAALKSGIPIHRFMEAFKDVLPQADMFTNRIEDSIGYLRAFGTNLSTKSLKEFMHAMNANWRQMSFRDKLKPTLITGVGKSRDLLNEQYERNISTIGVNDGLEVNRGEIKELLEATKNGSKTQEDALSELNQILLKIEKGGGKVEGAVKESLQETIRLAANYKNVDALSTASDMELADTTTRMETMLKNIERITEKSISKMSDFTGLKEHVFSTLNIGKDQKSMLETYMKKVFEFKETIKSGDISSKFIRTGDKEALEEVLKSKKLMKDGESLDETIKRMMKEKGGEEELMKAYKDSFKITGSKEGKLNKEVEDAQAAFQKSQGEMSSTIVDILNNLYKIIKNKLAPYILHVLDILKSWYKWLLGDKKTEDDDKLIKKEHKDDGSEFDAKVNENKELQKTLKAKEAEYNKFGSVSKYSDGKKQPVEQPVEQPAVISPPTVLTGKFLDSYKEKEKELKSKTTNQGVSLYAYKSEKLKIDNELKSYEDTLMSLQKQMYEDINLADEQVNVLNKLNKNDKDSIKIGKESNVQLNAILKTLDENESNRILEKDNEFMEWFNAKVSIGSYDRFTSKKTAFDAYNKEQIGSKAVGGPIPVDKDGMWKLHGGEYIIPKGGALVKTSSNSGVSTYNISVNVKTDADPKQIAYEINRVLKEAGN